MFDYDNTVISNNDIEIQFKFERYNYNAFGGGEEDTKPLYYTHDIPLPANSIGNISVDIPNQGDNKYHNIIFYLKNADKINITNIKLTCDID